MRKVELSAVTIYISQLIRLARVSSHVDDFNTRNTFLIAKLLKQGYRYHKLRKAFKKLSAVFRLSVANIISD